MVREVAFYEAAERRIERLTLLIGIVAAAAVLFLYGWRFAAGLLGGALGGWLNFRWLRQGVGAAVALVASKITPSDSNSSSAASGAFQSAAEESQPSPPKIPKRIYLRILARYALLLIVVYVILSTHFVPGVAVLAGLFAVVAAVLLEMLYELFFTPERQL